MMSGREQVRRRAEQARRLSHKFCAEAMGLLWALEAQLPMPYSTDPEIQAEFLRGHAEGRELLTVKEEVLR